MMMLFLYSCTGGRTQRHHIISHHQTHTLSVARRSTAAAKLLQEKLKPTSHGRKSTAMRPSV